MRSKIFVFLFYLKLQHTGLYSQFFPILLQGDNFKAACTSQYVTVWSSYDRLLLINNCSHQPGKNWLNYLCQEEPTFNLLALCSSREPVRQDNQTLLALDTRHAMQEGRIYTNSLPRSYREEKLFLLPSSGFTSIDTRRIHHTGTEQISMLYISPTAHLHLNSFRGIR